MTAAHEPGLADAGEEFPVVFRCEGTELVGIINRPRGAELGVVLVAGGDQYRVGSHRLFVQLARNLADAGVAVLRFDHRGIGDNRGNYDGFENTFPDIEAAVETLASNVPGLRSLALCGLCDGASAALMAGHQIDKVHTLLLINPWVHSSNLEARARIEGYYISRLRGKEFWKKLVTGKINVPKSLLSLGGYLIHFLKSTLTPETTMLRAPGYVYRMLVGLRRFDGRVLVALSGNDLVAQEFRELVKMQRRWSDVMSRDNVRVLDFPTADHSFTSACERRALEHALAATLREESEA